MTRFLFVFGCVVDWFSSWRHCRSTKKCCPKKNSHAGMYQSLYIFYPACLPWGQAENKIFLDQMRLWLKLWISDHRLNSTHLWKTGCLIGLWNGLTRALLLSTLIANAPRYVQYFKNNILKKRYTVQHIDCLGYICQFSFLILITFVNSTI